LRELFKSSRICNRNHDRDQKPFRKNHDPILIRKSIGDFEIEIDLRFSFANRSALEKPFPDEKYRENAKSDPDFRTKLDQRF